MDARGKTGTSVTGRQGGRQDMDTTHRDLEAGHRAHRRDAACGRGAARGRAARAAAPRTKAGTRADRSGPSRGAHRGHRLGRGRRPRHRGQGRPAHPARARHEPLDVRRGVRGCFAGSVYLPEAPGATRKRVRFGFYLDAAPPRAARHRRRVLRHGRGAPSPTTSRRTRRPRVPSTSCCAISIREDFLRLVDVEGELSDIEGIIAAPSRLRGEDGRILPPP